MTPAPKLNELPPENPPATETPVVWRFHLPPAAENPDEMKAGLAVTDSGPDARAFPEGPIIITDGKPGDERTRRSAVPVLPHAAEAARKISVRW
ncbi:MAG: hypothetical protein JXR55_08195 [Candidatus Fermentibacteraceae bacterium]|nr:hypothetical protein [Candidatus Fermentibacteraceae bacterium]